MKVEGREGGREGRGKRAQTQCEAEGRISWGEERWGRDDQTEGRWEDRCPWAFGRKGGREWGRRADIPTGS